MEPPSRPCEKHALRLHALDGEDLSLLSAHLQDALVRVGDIAFLPDKRRFALVGSRFDWAAEIDGRLERCRCGVHFEGVQRVRCQRICREHPDAILELLAVIFEPGAEPPSGVIRLYFAGGASIALDVECVEAQLCDVGPRWKVAARPAHDLGGELGGDLGGELGVELGGELGGELDEGAPRGP